MSESQANPNTAAAGSEKKPHEPERFKDYHLLEDKSGFKIDGSDHVFHFDEEGGWFDEHGNYYNADAEPDTPAYEEEKNEHPPEPERFKDFKLLEDKSGFKIEGSDHVFHFDQDGGWYDEHENYYNSNGEPCDPPEDEDEDDYYEDEGNPLNEYDLDEEDDNVADMYKEYLKYKQSQARGDEEQEGYNHNVQELQAYNEDDLDHEGEDEDEQVDEKIEKVVNDKYYNDIEATKTQNLKKLDKYKDDDIIRTIFTNVSYKVPMWDFRNFLEGKGLKIYGFSYNKFGDYSHQGSAYVAFSGKANTAEALKIHGQEFNGRKIYVSVKNYNETDTTRDAQDRQSKLEENKAKDPKQKQTKPEKKWNNFDSKAEPKPEQPKADVKPDPNSKNDAFFA